MNRISRNDGWRFRKYGPAGTPDGLIYDVRAAEAE
jgi:hypothetical protein